MQEYEVSKRLGPDFDYVSIIKSIRAGRSNTAYRQHRIAMPQLERQCELCQKVMPFYEFPYIKSTRCFSCQNSKKPLNLTDKNLKIVETYKNYQWLGSNYDYDSIIRRLHEEKAKKTAVAALPATRVIDTYKCEVPIEKVREYLDQCHKKHAKAKFYYKNQLYTREVDIQILSEAYLTGETSVGRRTFRIDRITKI